jgi:hypothetical protein
MGLTSDPHPAAPREGTVIRPLLPPGSSRHSAHGIAATLGVATPTCPLTCSPWVCCWPSTMAPRCASRPGSLADRIGPRPVLLGGLLGFAGVSAAFVLAGNPLGWGWPASPRARRRRVSPAAGAMIARLAPDRRRGRAFGSYGRKGLGYARPGGR